jgi:glycine cleavage system H lipoate-binding protein
MQTLLAVVESIGIFIAGMAVRLGLLLLVLGALTLLFLAGLAVFRLFEAAKRRAQGVSRVDGVLFQDNVHYAPGHTWVRPVGSGRVRVGMDDLAERLLAGLSHVTLPRPGTVFREGEPAFEVACGRKKASIVAPVDGKVVAVNQAAAREPGMVRRDPYHRGWLLEIEVPTARYKSLPAGEAARAWLDSETRRLTGFLEHELGIAAADGGELVAPGPGLLTDEQWRNLTAHFLSAEESGLASRR